MTSDIVFSEQDHLQFDGRNMSLDRIRRQIGYLQNGVPLVSLDRPALVGDGIRVIREEDRGYLLRLYKKGQEAGRFSKFVPSSGAASRMFELLFEFDCRKDDLSVEMLARESKDGRIRSRNFLGFLRQIKRLAFYEDLKNVLSRHLPDDIEQWTPQDISDVLKGLLGKTGLDYASRPKGLIKFHCYEKGSRTAFEEHLVEGFEYLKDSNNVVRAHFTISEEHENQVRQCISAFQARYNARRIILDVTYSFQKNSTDTLALDESGQLLRDASGKLVFRPGGHGALLENLKGLEADLVFIKNIDNIAPDALKENVVAYQMILGGYLMRLQDKIFSFLRQLDGEIGHARFWEELSDFCLYELMQAPDPSVMAAPVKERHRYFHVLLNRPVRVCAMVPNKGEPGGGPFWVKGSDGNVSLQIVESTQVDHSSVTQEALWSASTHFNPVNLVCGLRNYKGEPFDLNAFVNQDSGLVAVKKKGGKPVRIFEWPGLWNGGMAGWITVFVETPVETFTPVKTVLDLLRPEHQA